MSVHSKTIIETTYTITCDFCYRCEKVVVSRCYGYDIYNCRQAVRSLGWSYGRNNLVKCSNCRCRNKK